jgi:hypothetical protein
MAFDILFPFSSRFKIANPLNTSMYLALLISLDCRAFVSVQPVMVAVGSHDTSVSQDADGVNLHYAIFQFVAPNMYDDIVFCSKLMHSCVSLLQWNLIVIKQFLAPLGVA